MVVALSPVLDGCWWTQNAAATSEYARQVSTATLRVAQLEAEQVESDKRIEQLEEVIRLQGQSQAERIDNFDEVNAEVIRLRGAIEVLQHNLDEVREQFDTYTLAQERRQLHDEKRLLQVETFLGVAAPPPPTDAELGIAVAESSQADGSADAGTTDGAGLTTEPAADPIPADAAGKLEQAVQHMAEGRHAVARAILKKAILEHAGDPLMPEIRYRNAETRFNEQNWRKAAVQFKQVIDNHPKSEWSCWAHYRQGECFEAMGAGGDAKLFYKAAAQGFCGRTEAGKAAKNKL